MITMHNNAVSHMNTNTTVDRSLLANEEYRLKRLTARPVIKVAKCAAG